MKIQSKQPLPVGYNPRPMKPRMIPPVAPPAPVMPLAAQPPYPPRPGRMARRPRDWHVF